MADAPKVSPRPAGGLLPVRTTRDLASHWRLKKRASLRATQPHKLHRWEVKKGLHKGHDHAKPNP